MKHEIKDEIIEELWDIKDRFAFSCDGDLRRIMERMNKIAREQTKELGPEINRRESIDAA
jgi:hypothetical protein